MFSTEKKLIVFVSLCCLVLALLGYAWKQRTAIPYVTVPMARVTTPFTYGASFYLAKFHTGIALIDTAINGTRKIDELASENARLKQQALDDKELLAENQRLHELLMYRNSHRQFDMVVAQVMTRDVGSWTNTFTISLGSADGIKPNMAVVIPSGVVGFVSDVYDYSARVQTLLDPRTSIGVIVQRPESRVSAVVKGGSSEPNKLNMVNVAKDSDVLVGDTLITSGYGGIYPKGLPVGTVLTMKPDAEGFVKNGIVQPAADFSQLEEVFVILQSRETTPDKPVRDVKLVPQTQRDQVEGVKGAGQ